MPTGVNNKQIGKENRDIVRSLIDQFGEGLQYNKALPHVKKRLGRSISENTFNKHKASAVMSLRNQQQESGKRVATKVTPTMVADAAVIHDVLKVDQFSRSLGGLARLKECTKILEDFQKNYPA